MTERAVVLDTLPVPLMHGLLRRRGEPERPQRSRRHSALEDLEPTAGRLD